MGLGIVRTWTYTTNAIKGRIDGTNRLTIPVSSRASLHRVQKNVGIVEEAERPGAEIILHGIREPCPEKCRSRDLPPVKECAWAMTVEPALKGEDVDVVCIQAMPGIPVRRAIVEAKVVGILDVLDTQIGVEVE